MSAELAAGPVAQGEHRGCERHRCEFPTTCQPPSAWWKDPWPATIRDISTTGLSLTLGRRFETGSGLAIQLPNADGTTSTVLARVVQLLALPEGGWRIGCTFISELSDEEVQLVLNPVSHATLGDPGIPAPAEPASSVADVLFQVRLHPGETLRWFVKRLHLCSTWPLAPGKVVSLRFGGLPGPPTPVQIKVTACRRFAASWVIAGNLLSEPSHAIIEELSCPLP